MADTLNVLITQPFPDTLIERVRAVSPGLSVTRAKPADADFSAVDVLYGNSPPRELGRAPRLKWVQVHMAGVDSLRRHPLYTDSTVPIATASGVHAGTIAQYAVTMLLALAHRVSRMIEWQHAGVWPPDRDRWSLFLPTEVRGATLGIIGYGSIGRELARIARTAFGMAILACKRDPSKKADDGYVVPGTGDPAGALPDEWFGPKDLHAMLALSDVVVMAAPLTGETERMIDAIALAAMKPTAYFINVGRGASVDEAALAQALADKQIAGAAVDVFAEEPPPKGHPLYGAPNAILSPHVSGFVASYDERCTDLFCENLRRHLRGAPLLNVVDRGRGY
jgi:phosphoglycerate dehydrogenase-like enzyme